MESFNYNARNYTDFLALSDSDDEEGEKYFDVDHEFDYTDSTSASNDRTNGSEDDCKSTLASKNSPEAAQLKRKRNHKSCQPPTKFVCMAEAVEKFQRTTPARFHTKPRFSKFEFKGKRLSHLKTTVPTSPHLQVMKRNRPVTALSRWQIEDMEVEEMKKHQVKARPINEKILKPAPVNVSHQSHTTEVKPFNITEFKRKIHVEPAPDVVVFKARPIPKGLFDKKETQDNISTKAISIRHRVPVVKKDQENENKPAKLEKKGPTHPSPFSFEERDKMLMKRKEQYIKKVLEEEKKAREFHANPIPKFAPKKLYGSDWSISSTQSTVPQPFNLSSVERSKAVRERLERKIEEEKELLKKAAQFKAKPATVLSQKPFIPKKSEHFTEVCDVKLNTEVRAHKRSEYIAEKKEREEEMEKMRMERKRQLEERELEQVAEMRKQMIHKANPVRCYKGVTIHPSNKPLTSPYSPHKFAKKNASLYKDD